MASRPLSHLLRQQRGASLLRCRQRMLSSQQPEPAASSESLIPTTLAEMEADIGDSEGVSATLAAIKKVGQARLTREEKRQRRRALDAIGVPEFIPFLQSKGVLAEDAPLERFATTMLQVNVGLYCNQACNHCHVESSPKRTETMSDATVARILEVLAASPSVTTLDITGGAPEMNAAFKPLVEGASALGVEIIDRCNLTVMMEPSMDWLGPFLAEHRVRIVASLPCYSQKNVDTQRGSKVFDRSIAGLRALNELGYGVPGSDLKLDLVYNPGGAFLPPPQEVLQAKYAEELEGSFGIRFNELFTMTNMPIKRFADLLYKQGKLNEYMQVQASPHGGGVGMRVGVGGWGCVDGPTPSMLLLVAAPGADVCSLSLYSFSLSLTHTHTHAHLLCSLSPPLACALLSAPRRRLQPRHGGLRHVPLPRLRLARR